MLSFFFSSSFVDSPNLCFLSFVLFSLGIFYLFFSSFFHCGDGKCVALTYSFMPPSSSCYLPTLLSLPFSKSYIDTDASRYSPIQHTTAGGEIASTLPTVSVCACQKERECALSIFIYLYRCVRAVFYV